MKPSHKVLALLSVAVFTTVFAGAASPSQNSPQAGFGPRIKFDEPQFDFGKIKSTDVVGHEFILRNTGDAVLQISNVKPACGCTTAGSWDRDIQPGQTGKIPIQFNPANFDGVVNKSIEVTSNDAKQAVFSLKISATILRPIVLSPPFVQFDPVEGEKNSETKIVHIRNNLDEPLALGPAKSSSPDFDTGLKTIKPGKEFELQISYAGLVHGARSEASINIATSSEEVPIITVAATVIPQPAVTVVPSRIVLPSEQPTGRGYSQVVFVLNGSSVPMKLTDAKVNAEEVTTEVTEARAGKLYDVALNFPPSFTPRIHAHTALTIRTSNPRHPIITVPIEARPNSPDTKTASVSGALGSN